MTEDGARRWIREVHGKVDRPGNVRAVYLTECLDALVAGRPLPDPSTSGRWNRGVRESRLEVLERLYREEEA